MITTVYKCDRCGAEQFTEKQMWDVGIYTKHLFDPVQLRSSRLWCRACCDVFQLILPPMPNVDPPVVEITLEEKIREFLRGMIREEVS